MYFVRFWDKYVGLTLAHIYLKRFTSSIDYVSDQQRVFQLFSWICTVLIKIRKNSLLEVKWKKVTETWLELNFHYHVTKEALEAMFKKCYPSNWLCRMFSNAPTSLPQYKCKISWPMVKMWLSPWITENIAPSAITLVHSYSNDKMKVCT